MEQDPWINYSLGRQQFKSVRKFGSNGAVGISFEDIWSGQGLYTGFLQAAGVASIVPDDVNDTLAGSGARKMCLCGLDQDWNNVTEEVELNGTTPVASTTTFIRLWRMFVSEVGTYGGENAGEITATVGGNVCATVPAGFGQTQIAIYTVPASHRAFITGIRFSSDATRIVSFRLKIRDRADDLTNLTAARVYDRFPGIIESVPLQLKMPIKLGEKTDVWVQAQGAAGTTDCAAELDILIQKVSTQIR